MSIANNIILNETGTAANIENYKIVIVGDQSVGKTSILSKFKYETVEEEYKPTVGIDFITKNVFLEDKTVRLILWDTAGQERFKSLIPSYIKNSHAVIITYDITSKASFLSINQWLKDIKNEVAENTLIIVAGNKIDLNNKRTVSKEEAEKFCSDNSLPHVETSALTGEGIKKLFDIIARSFYGSPAEYNNQEKPMVLENKEEPNSKKKSGCCQK